MNESHAAEWRDARLKQVSGSSVNREWTILSNACNIAIKEWKWLTRNPFHEVKRPKDNPPRDRLATLDEIERLIHSSGYDEKNAPQTIAARVMASALFAMQTGMRCKEICQLKPDMVHEDYVEVGIDTKTGKRHVPLSKEAKRIIEQMLLMKLDTVFGLKESQVDVHWRKITSMAEVKNLHYHDCKHFACTWMAQKVSVFDLARILGTRDLKTLSIYYNPSASDIAKRLD